MLSKPMIERPTPLTPGTAAVASPRVRAASLDDVAALAGVSSGTVSRALSRPEMISEATRQRVLEAANRIGYVPNGAARAMALRRTFTVGAVIPRFGTSSFPTMVQALEAELAERGYTLLLAAPGNKQNQTEMVRTLIARGVDALVLLGSRYPQEVIGLLRTQGTPFVRLWTQDDSLGPCVGFDEAQAAALVIDHLADLGHHEIGFIGGYTKNNERAEARLSGLTRAVARRGLVLREDATVETEYGFQEGFDAMEWIRSGGCPITAVVCGNDYLAAGALAALDQAGVSVPEQLSVASFNDNDFAPFLHPPLTTLHLPIKEMGELAARYLVSVLQNQNPQPIASLPMALKVRRSTGPRK
ncbi:LacI family DNA-binding transcriptional regulator [[Acidovorax] ebreus]|uniref:LacI family DNA-binding transcriptional regulator n=1 Tax=Diaphorobacter sp. LI3 TaxID=2952886 RepID=UPI00206CBE7E|nr:LacI family transcriptional regulator [Diaphorobacter sp. LI3]